jgi:hypothetical protein
MFSWKVQTIKDRGADQWYRFHITGLILDEGREPVPFSWSVRDMDNPTYDLSGAVHLT